MTEISRAVSNQYPTTIASGATKVEKPIIQKAVDTAKIVGTNIKDSAKDVIKTPEGKAIVIGLVLSPFVPVIGPAIALGGAAAAAFKFIKDSVKNSKTPENKPNTESMLNNIKKGAIIAAGATLGAVAGIPGMIAAGTLTKIALDSAEKTQKGKATEKSSVTKSEMQWAKQLEFKVSNGIYSASTQDVEKYTKIFNKANEVVGK